jgi:5'-nucleotidase
MEKKQILLTNDDGIQSPGLWAAAEALSALGYVTVAAPREQSSGTGRSLPNTSDGRIQPQILNVRGQNWTVYAVGGTPAQAVLYAVLEIMPTKPELVVSGINYGENVGMGVTVSGTVGAAMEGASLGIPSLAISLETDREHFFSYSNEVDFSAAAHFATVFGRLLLEKKFPEDVDLLKVEVPKDATPHTPWMLTRLSRQAYFPPRPPERSSWDQPAGIGFSVRDSFDDEPQDSDAYALRVRRSVAVTPLSLDMTSRADFRDVEKILGSN